MGADRHRLTMTTSVVFLFVPESNFCSYCTSSSTSDGASDYTKCQNDMPLKTIKQQFFNSYVLAKKEKEKGNLSELLRVINWA